MKLGVLLSVGIVALFAGLANIWFGDMLVGLGLVAIFVVVAGYSAWQGKKEYDARPRGEPIID
ncbi:hypothetical protein OVA11_17475 [Caulobacter sp. SL161]|uniref:hypothetical protein n=1 Tax=Caulobacter sp. SL161 TaxID=2995156 RepID=UPI002273913E|nr:hypothetical protein [Caulobacter sp. SL161]MCY1648781.1 hypothetical protein [Caulobacter sp. SL161]